MEINLFLCFIFAAAFFIINNPKSINLSEKNQEILESFFLSTLVTPFILLVFFIIYMVSSSAGNLLMIAYLSTKMTKYIFKKIDKIKKDKINNRL